MGAREPKVRVRITDPDGDYTTQWSIELRDPTGQVHQRDATWPGSGPVFRARFPAQADRTGRWSGTATRKRDGVDQTFPFEAEIVRPV
jgi:hypothetical protein